MKKKVPKSYILDIMDIDIDQKLFRDNNQAYYFSSRFLPKSAREDVSKLYGFLNLTRDYSKNKDLHKIFFKLVKLYENAVSDHTFETISHSWDDTDTRIIKNIVHLQYKYKFDQTWVETYFKTLEKDKENDFYNNLDQVLKYVSGTAEVIGLMIAKILDLPEEVNKYVEAQSRATAWINFINHIAEDSLRDKCYFSTDELKKYNLEDLKEETIKLNTESYKKFIQFQLSRYKKWQAEALRGIKFIPERYQVAIRTTISMDDWIAKKIEKNPEIIYQKDLIPRRQRIIRQVIKNTAKGTARVTVRTTKKVSSGVKNVKPATKAVVPKIKQAPKVAKEKVKELTDKYIETED